MATLIAQLLMQGEEEGGENKEGEEEEEIKLRPSELWSEVMLIKMLGRPSFSFSLWLSGCDALCLYVEDEGEYDTKGRCWRRTIE